MNNRCGGCGVSGAVMWAMCRRQVNPSFELQHPLDGNQCFLTYLFVDFHLMTLVQQGIAEILQRGEFHVFALLVG